MKLLVDLNLTPRWIPFLTGHGVESTHWSSVGHSEAKDTLIAQWARQYGYWIMTNDLDFPQNLGLYASKWSKRNSSPWSTSHP